MDDDWAANLMKLSKILKGMMYFKPVGHFCVCTLFKFMFEVNEETLLIDMFEGIFEIGVRLDTHILLDQYA